MQGYDPDQRRRSEAGGCREALLLIRIAFEVLLPPIGVIFAVLILIVAAFMLLAVHPALALLPVLPVAAAAVWLIRRDRRLQRELEEEVRGGPR